MKTTNSVKSGVFLSLFLLTAICTMAQDHGYHLINKTVVGGEGGWDYLSVDHENGRIYLSHSSQVEVLDLASNKKIGVIGPVSGVHGVIAVAKHKRGITTNGRSNTATIFDLTTLQPIIELPTGKNPDALLYDAFSDRVFVFNHSGASATAIDIAAGKVLGTIELGGEGVEAGATNGKGTIYVNLEDASEIVAFDAKTLAVKNRWKTAPGEEPTGLALDTVSHRLFTVCHNSLMIILDSDNGNVVAKVPIGKGVDGVVFDPETQLAISSNGEGTITVVKEVSPTEFSVKEAVTTSRGARTIAIDYKTHHVFVTTAQYGTPPAPTKENPNPRSPVIPGTFMLLEFGMQ